MFEKMQRLTLEMILVCITTIVNPVQTLVITENQKLMFLENQTYIDFYLL